MGRVGVTIPMLVICGLLVSACNSGSPIPPKSSGGPTAPKKTVPARVTTQTVRVGRFTQIFDTPLPADPAQASAVEGFRTGMILWDKSTEALRLVSPVTASVTGDALHDLICEGRGSLSGTRRMTATSSLHCDVGFLPGRLVF